MITVCKLSRIVHVEFSLMHNTCLLFILWSEHIKGYNNKVLKSDRVLELITSKR